LVTAPDPPLAVICPVPLRVPTSILIPPPLPPPLFFTHKAAGAPKSLTAGDYDTLRKAGLSEATIMEVLGVVWANTAMNMIVDALGVTRTSEQQKELSVL